MAYDWIANKFKDELDLDVSVDSGTGKHRKVGNTDILVSNRWLRTKLALRTKVRRLKLVARAKNLGVEQRGAG
eukprot:3937839-Karenia_brevis.AAC.1